MALHPASGRPRGSAVPTPLLLGLLLSGACGPGACRTADAASLQFGAPFVACDVPADPFSMAVGDVNRDGRDDFVALSAGLFTNGTRLTVQLAGAGPLLDGARTEQAIPQTSQACFLRDVTGDGVLDIVILGGQVAVYRGLGNGTFLSPYASGVGGGIAAMADLDGEGSLDLVISSGTTGVIVELNQGPGLFDVQTTYPTAGFVAALAAGDLDGDHIPDVVAACGSTLTVYFGEPGGTLGRRIDLAAGASLSRVVVGDVDGDSWPDICGCSTDSHAVFSFRGTGSGTFLPAFGVPVADSPWDVVLVDLSGDGRLDIATASGISRTVSVLLNPLTPAAVRRDFVSGYGTMALAAGEFTGDGRADIVVACRATTGGPEAPGRLVVLPGDGQGALGETVAYRDEARDVIVADFDGDGRSDLATASATAPNVRFGQPDGKLAPPLAQPPLGSDARFICAADLDRDGRAEILVGRQYYFSVGALNAAREFVPGATYTVPATLQALALGDLNGDGWLDVVDCVGSGQPMGVRLGTGNGGLGPRSAAPTTEGTVNAVVADLSGDGRADLVTIAGSELGVRPGAGDGTFGAAVRYPVAGTARTLIVADFNRDGRPDVLVSGPAATVTGYLNGGNGLLGPRRDFPLADFPSQILAADFDLDGQVDLVAPLAYRHGIVTFLRGRGDGTFRPGVAYGVAGLATRVAIGDLNHDGGPDLVVFAPGSTDPVTTLLLNRSTPEPVPVDPLVIVATRRADRTELRVERVRGEDASVALRAYRQAGDGDREPLSGDCAARGSACVWVDPRPYDARVRYWVEEVLRTGRAIWHGPIAPEPAPVAELVRLGAPAPNPTRNATVIEFTLTRPGHASLGVFDAQGRRVALLFDREFLAGLHRASWDGAGSGGRPVGAGTYFVRLETLDGVASRRLSLTR